LQVYGVETRSAPEFPGGGGFDGLFDAVVQVREEVVAGEGFKVICRDDGVLERLAGGAVFEDKGLDSTLKCNALKRDSITLLP
jgi:hypothetical protein